MKIRKNQQLVLKFINPEIGFPKHITRVLVSKFLNENMFMVETVSGISTSHSIILDKRQHGKTYTLTTN